MDTVIEMTPEMKKPGIGILSIPMSVFTAGTIMSAMQTIDTSSMSELEKVTVEVFVAIIAQHVRENAIEKMAQLGIADIEQHLNE